MRPSSPPSLVEEHRERCQRAGLESVMDLHSELCAGGRLLEMGPMELAREVSRAMKEAYQLGVEAQADALQPEFSELSERLARAEGNLSGRAFRG